MNEVYQAVFGFWIGNEFWGWGRYLTEGSPASVEFDYKKVWGNNKLIGFYHTHPASIGYPSSIDFATMGAWVNSEGPLLCFIEGTDGLNVYLFNDDELDIQIGRAHRCSNYFRGEIYEQQLFTPRDYIPWERSLEVFS